MDIGATDQWLDCTVRCQIFQFLSMIIFSNEQLKFLCRQDQTKKGIEIERERGEWC